MNTNKHEDWSSSFAFLMATVGSAVGLGNLWRFPYIAGENGGGAFVLVYLVFIFAVGVPLVMAELAMGRRGHQSPVGSLQILRSAEGAGGAWMSIGWLSILAPLVGLTFYSVVAGWSLDYIVKALRGSFTGISGTGGESLFDALLASPGRLILWHTVYLGTVVLIVGRGIRGGIERTTKVVMPILFLLLVILVIYANVAGDARRGFEFLFATDFHRLTSANILMALGQALFSISVGTGALLTYGAYLPSESDIPKAAWTIGIVDTAAALLAGFAIFPIVFASGLNPGEGPGLTFVTLPVAFGQMPAGQLFGTCFFVLVFFAAFTSSLAMLEPFVSWLEEHQGFRRFPMAVYSGAGVWIVGLSAVFSFNIWKDFKPFDMIPLLEGRTIFSLLDFAVSNLMLPINAFLIAVFAGWVMSRRTMCEEFGMHAGIGIGLWSLLVRYFAPVAVAAVFVFNFFA